MLAQSLREDMQAVTRNWGWFLAAGIAWIVFAFFVLSFNYRTVWAVAVFFGIGFIIGGVMELAVASVAPAWKWLYILIGVVSIIAGVIALIWPGQTFLVLAAIVGWLLLFYGIIDIIFARHEAPRRSPGGCRLISGIIMVLLGFWAISPDESTVSTYRGAVLLVVWIGVAALFSPTSSSASGCAPLVGILKTLAAPDGQRIEYRGARRQPGVSTECKRCAHDSPSTCFTVPD